MFSWILIALAIAVIFGVIKIDDLKPFIQKWLPKLKEIFNQAKSKVEAKAAELKANENKEENTKAEEDKPAE